MQFVRFLSPEGPRWGQLDANTILELNDAPYSGGKATGRTFALQGVRLLPPVVPSKIVCIGKNYADHAAERGGTAPTTPMFFLKPPSALIPSGDAIVLPNPDHENHWEAELALVIGKTAKGIDQADALQHVFGYTIVNDVSDRTFQDGDGKFGFGRGKCFDTFCPCGPVLVTEGVNPLDVQITLTCNGEVRQNDSTALMVHPVPKLLAHLSQIMTLEPGDLVLTGTPKGVGAMHPGDTVAITIDGIGTLTNPVR
ncbi:MAG: fumarylacetoacetate hydrolase family protein [Mycobacterium leprae]